MYIFENFEEYRNKYYIFFDKTNINSKEKRFFSIIPSDILPNNNNHSPGKYCGKIPLQAAIKAFNQIIKKDKAKNKNLDILEYTFSIQEITEFNKKHCIYKYVGIKTKRKEPKILNFKNNITCTIYYDTKVIPIKKYEKMKINEKR